MICGKTVEQFVRKGELEKIENYEKAVADKTQIWACHHRLELTLDGEFAHSKEDLKRMGMYYNRPYFELIFLTRAEHCILHNKARSEETKKKLIKAMKGRKLTDENKKRISEAKEGKKLVPLSLKHKKKISEKLKNKSHTEFGRKYIAHFGYSERNNPRQYKREYDWYRSHNKCSWEV